jgi:hypothetical protein
MQRASSSDAPLFERVDEPVTAERIPAKRCDAEGGGAPRRR